MDNAFRDPALDVRAGLSGGVNWPIFDQWVWQLGDWGHHPAHKPASSLYFQDMDFALEQESLHSSNGVLNGAVALLIRCNITPLELICHVETVPAHILHNLWVSLTLIALGIEIRTCWQISSWFPFGMIWEASLAFFETVPAHILHNLWVSLTLIALGIEIRTCWQIASWFPFGMIWEASLAFSCCCQSLSSFQLRASLYFCSGLLGRFLSAYCFRKCVFVLNLRGIENLTLTHWLLINYALDSCCVEHHQSITSKVIVYGSKGKIQRVVNRKPTNQNLVAGPAYAALLEAERPRNLNILSPVELGCNVHKANKTSSRWEPYTKYWVGRAFFHHMRAPCTQGCNTHTQSHLPLSAGFFSHFQSINCCCCCCCCCNH